MMFPSFNFSLFSISYLALVGASLSLTSFFAQKQIDNQLNGWVVYQGNHKLNKQFDLHTEYQWRRADGFNDWQQSLARVGLDYKLNPSVTISGGYAWILTYPYGSQPIANRTNENRLWQQVILKQPIGNFQVQHRYRLEQRWIDTLFRQRMRYRAQCIIPLQNTYLKEGKGLFMNVNDEIFLGFGKGIGKNILDQNRFIAAVGYQFSPNLNVQMGYLNQFVIKANGVQMERNHTQSNEID
jgi:predicted porin